ncbi:Nif3-like dinuclear metal center hexameric protein [Paenibacillus daejeonensis]|uniref:Nif3-like dinuclear metal center hexameric protein n=1 Tax=Paenibacillus daejeonensis TaxID=135193 RepID=UPI000372D8F8|nr:Nif3-like dinuclear metal center hexameric protein [Paenibacillus daejeonensis]
MGRTVGDFLQVVEALSGTADSSGVDGLVCGDPESILTGVAVVFSATLPVLEATVASGANLIIAHEGVYYRHHAGEDWLSQDSVYRQKKEWITSQGLSIWRNHDGWHRRVPDGIMQGLVHTLGWDDRIDTYLPTAAVATIPPVPLATLAKELKFRLAAPFIRLGGDPAMISRRIGLLAGYRGNMEQALPLLQEHGVDTLIAGEGPEWELPEYMTDACHQGGGRGLLMVGHAVSEEPGMRYLAEELQSLVPDVQIHYIAGPAPLSVI